MNEIGHKCDTRCIRRNKNGTVVAPSPFLVKQMRANFILPMQTFHYKIAICIQ